MKLLATHAFNCIVLMVKFGRTSCEDIPPALFCYICDQICQKGSYTPVHAQFQDATFHHHLLATSMDQQRMCLILLKVEWSSFTQASF